MNGAGLTQLRLKDLLHYDPETGVFTWRVRTSNRVCVGDVAGQNHPAGYISICIDAVRILAHRLAWFYMIGAWPREQIDHKNGIGTDNRWANLREAGKRINAENMRRARRDNATGLLGVRRMRDKFQANIRVNGRLRNLGTYPTPERAYAAYLEAKRKLHEGCTL